MIPEKPKLRRVLVRGVQWGRAVEWGERNGSGGEEWEWGDVIVWQVENPETVVYGLGFHRSISKQQGRGQRYLDDCTNSLNVISFPAVGNTCKLSRTCTHV